MGFLHDIPRQGVRALEGLVCCLCSQVGEFETVLRLTREPFAPAADSVLFRMRLAGDDWVQPFGGYGCNADANPVIRTRPVRVPRKISTT